MFIIKVSLRTIYNICVGATAIIIINYLGNYLAVKIPFNVVTSITIGTLRYTRNNFNNASSKTLLISIG